jgi:hypothetical protein
VVSLVEGTHQVLGQVSDFGAELMRRAHDRSILVQCAGADRPRELSQVVESLVDVLERDRAQANSSWSPPTSSWRSREAP